MVSWYEVLLYYVIKFVYKSVLKIIIRCRWDDIMDVDIGLWWIELK